MKAFHPEGDIILKRLHPFGLNLAVLINNHLTLGSEEGVLMLEIAIMIEGQYGLTWSRWQKIARLVEELGFVGLYRSDHFTNSNPPDLKSLELWTSLTWLADNTNRIEFGPLVTPFSFRHPVHTARMASAVDDLSGGTVDSRSWAQAGRIVNINCLVSTCWI